MHVEESMPIPTPQLQRKPSSSRSKHFKWSSPHRRRSERPIAWHFLLLVVTGSPSPALRRRLPELPPGEMEGCPDEWVGEAVAFLRRFRARFASAPAVRDEFLVLLAGAGVGGGDAGAVVARANEILARHPDLLAEFSAFLRGGAAAGGGSLAASRPRRSVGRKDGGGAAAQDDGRLTEVFEFMGQVRQRAGDAAHAAFVAVLLAAGADESMDADAVYAGVKEALGPAHGNLLETFAAVYLPGKPEWDAQEAKREHASSSNAGEDDADAPTTAGKSMKPLAGDESHRHALHGGGSSGGVRASARHQRYKSLEDSWPQEIVGGNGKEKLPRQFADDHGGNVLGFKGKSNNVPHDGKFLGFNVKNNHVSDHGKALGLKFKNGNVPDDGKVYGFKDKNGGHAAAGDSSRRHASRAGKEASGRKAEARAPVPDGGEKRPCRRAKNGEGSSAVAAAAAALAPAPPALRPVDLEARRFRRMWEFETGYSRLLATVARAEELLLLHGGGAHAGAGGAARSVEEFFPSRECRDFLRHCYGEHPWREMRVALERGGACAGVALGSMVRRLREKEAAAVDDARVRRREEDPGRAAKRLNTLATCELEEERRRRMMIGASSPAGKSSTPCAESTIDGDDRRRCASGALESSWGCS
ncbi:hypothetical protein ACP4OV_023261 [Aristida adscensionis]